MLAEICSDANSIATNTNNMFSKELKTQHNLSLELHLQGLGID